MNDIFSQHPLKSNENTENKTRKIPFLQLKTRRKEKKKKKKKPRESGNDGGGGGRRLRKTVEKSQWAVELISLCAGSTRLESHPLAAEFLRAVGGRS